MFNLGGDDKEKLKENMEEIRDLVNSQSEAENQGSETQEQPSTEPDKDFDQIKDQVENQVETQKPPAKKQPSQSDQTETPSRTRNKNRQGAQRDFPTKNQEQSEGSDLGLDSEDSDMKEHLESISSEVKKMEDGERPSGETLFLEVDEFNQVETMVEEMKYLSREMKDLMDNLEDGVEEDRRVEGEAQDVLDEFAERREKIQSSIQ